MKSIMTTMRRGSGRRRASIGDSNKNPKLPQRRRAAAKTTQKHPHYEEEGNSSAFLSSSSPNAFESRARSRNDDGKMSSDKLAVNKEERQQIYDSTAVRDEKEEQKKTKMTTSSHESEDDRVYVDVLRKLKAYARLRIRHMGHFSKLLKFATFCILYCTMLYLQTEPILSFEVSSTVRGLLKPGIKSTQNMNYVYEWLSENVVDPIWTEGTVSKDGVCSAPYEFPAFGRFGCKADCGSATNLISLVIHIQSRFGNSPAVSALELMSQASWNLCLQDPGRYANDLPDLCWYAKDQKFLEVDTNKLIRLEVITGNWYVRLRGDHIGLVAGKIYRLEANGDLVLTPTVPLWLTCTKTSLFKNVQARVSKFAPASPSARSVKKEISSMSAEYVSSPRRRMDDLSLPPSPSSLFKMFSRETTDKNYSDEESDSQMNASSPDDITLGGKGDVGQTSRRNLKQHKDVTRLTDSNFFDAIETCLSKFEQGLHASRWEMLC